MNKLKLFNEKLKKSKIAIIGIGVSNLPLLDYLYKLNCDITIFSDNKIETDLSKYNCKTHEDGLKELVGFDIIFRSPGCLPTREEIKKEIARGAYVTTEVNEVVRLTQAKVIGVTGSDGKTTTTTLINLILKANGYKTYLGGNIGTPLFTKIDGYFMKCLNCHFRVCKYCLKEFEDFHMDVMFKNHCKVYYREDKVYLNKRGKIFKFFLQLFYVIAMFLLTFIGLYYLIFKSFKKSIKSCFFRIFYYVFIFFISFFIVIIVFPILIIFYPFFPIIIAMVDYQT